MSPLINHLIDMKIALSLLLINLIRCCIFKKIICRPEQLPDLTDVLCFIYENDFYYEDHVNPTPLNLLNFSCHMYWAIAINAFCSGSLTLLYS